VKVVVAHHPFDDREHLEMLTRCGADVFLTGHLHVSYTGATAARYNVGGRAAIVVEAGTAISTRMRGEANAFNVLRIDSGRVAIERFAWDDTAGTFLIAERRRFDRTQHGWIPAAESA